MRGVWPGVHTAGKHEAAHADPHQRPALPVPHLLQDLCAEADPQDPHDCPLTCEAIQVQGTGTSYRWPGVHWLQTVARLEPAWPVQARGTPAGESLAWALEAGVGGWGSGAAQVVFLESRGEEEGRGAATERAQIWDSVSAHLTLCR